MKSDDIGRIQSYASTGRILLLSVRVLIFGYVAYLVFILATDYHPQSGRSLPFVLFIMDTINLFIHEAGHFFLRPFGMFLSILGGSLFQCLIPALAVYVFLRQRSVWAGLAIFWLAESMVNVSIYIRDAPYKKLKLIASGLIHDWNWLLSGDLEAAEPLADIVFGLGILLGVAAIGWGSYRMIVEFREERLVVEE